MKFFLLLLSLSLFPVEGGAKEAQRKVASSGYVCGTVNKVGFNGITPYALVNVLKQRAKVEVQFQFGAPEINQQAVQTALQAADTMAKLYFCWEGSGNQPGIVPLRGSQKFFVSDYGNLPE